MKQHLKRIFAIVMSINMIVTMVPATTYGGYESSGNIIEEQNTQKELKEQIASQMGVEPDQVSLVYNEKGQAVSFSINSDNVALDDINKNIDDVKPAPCPVGDDFALEKEWKNEDPHEHAYSNGVCEKCGAIDPQVAEARIGNVYYRTIQSAVDSANSEDIITIHKDTSVTSPIFIDKKVTLELNGMTVSADSNFTPEAGNDKDSIFVIKRGGNLTINDEIGIGKITTNGNSKVYSAIKLTSIKDQATGDNAELTINSGIIEGYYYAVVGNGNRHNTKVVINGGTLYGTAIGDNIGIFQPQEGTLEINGGTIIGTTAVEVRGGSLKVTDGTLKGVASEFSEKANKNGSTIKGAALAISQHTTNKTVSINISGGEFEGIKALYEIDLQDDTSNNIAMSVTGGEFKGEVYSENIKEFVTGGSFNLSPSAFIKSGYIAKKDDNGLYIVTKLEDEIKDLASKTSDPTLKEKLESEEIINRISKSFLQNNAVSNFKDINIEGATENGSEVKIELQNFDAKLKNSDAIITKAEFNVEPVDANGNKVSVKDGEKLTFRLPVDSAIPEGTVMYVYHNSASTPLGYFDVKKSDNNEKYVEVSAHDFSIYGYEMLEGEATSPVAAIGTTGYATLADAINEAENNDIITLIDNVELVVDTIIPQGVTLTFAQGAVLRNDANLTIKGTIDLPTQTSETPAKLLVNMGILTIDTTGALNSKCGDYDLLQLGTLIIMAGGSHDINLNEHAFGGENSNAWTRLYTGKVTQHPNNPSDPSKGYAYEFEGTGLINYQIYNSDKYTVKSGSDFTIAYLQSDKFATFEVEPGAKIRFINPTDILINSKLAVTPIVPDGYKDKCEEVDGQYHYTVEEGTNVAQIGDDRYETLAEALEAAATASDKTVTLIAPVEIASTDTITINTGITLTFADATSVLTNKGTLNVSGTIQLIGEGTQCLINAGTLNLKSGGYLNSRAGDYDLLQVGTLNIEAGSYHRLHDNETYAFGPKDAWTILTAGKVTQGLNTPFEGDINALLNGYHYVFDQDGDTKAVATINYQLYNHDIYEIKNGTYTLGSITSDAIAQFIISDSAIIKLTKDSNLLLNNKISDTVKANAILPEGYELQEERVNGQYRYTVIEKDYVASIGTNKYESLAEALSHASDTDIVALLQDVALDSALEVNKNITLNLNGKDLTLNEVATISQGKTLTIVGGNDKGGLKCNKDIVINGTLDVTGISYGANGLYQGYPGSLVISSTGEVKLMNIWSALTPNWLMANSSTFFKNLETGAKVTTAYTYTYDKTLNIFTKESSVLYKSTLVRTGGSKYNEAYDNISLAQNKTNKSEDIVYLLKDAGSYTLSVGESLKVNKNNKSIEVLSPDQEHEVKEETVNNITTYTLEEKEYVAQIGDNRYETLQAAIDAVANNVETTIKMIDNETIIPNNSQSGVTIPDNKIIVLDLNGKTIDGSDSKGGTYELIENRGTLTITDSSASLDENGYEVTPGTGKITYHSTTPDPSWGYGTNTIQNYKGKLTINAGTIENTTVNGASYAIDNSNNQYSVELVVNGGTLKCDNGDATIRVYCNSSKPITNKVTINGGTIYCAPDAAVWLHNPWNSETKAPTGSLTINDGTFKQVEGKSYQALDIGGIGNNYTEAFAEINGGIFEGQIYIRNNVSQDQVGTVIDIKDGKFTSGTYRYGDDKTKDLNDLTADGYKIVEKDGKYVIVKAVAQIGDTVYESLQEALNVAAASDTTKTVTLLSNVTSDKDLTVDLENRNVILDLDGHVLTSNIAVTAPANSTLVFTLKNPIAKDTGKVVGDISVTNGKLTISKSTTQDVTVEGSIVLNNVADATIQGNVVQADPEKAAIEVTGEASLLKITNTATINAQGVAIDAKAGTVKVLSDSSTSKAQVNGTVSKAAGSTVAISGGVFTNELDSSMIADGYKAVQNDDGKYEIVEKIYVAENITTGAKYETLPSAISAANKGDKIVILEDIIYDSTKLYQYTAIQKDITIDLAGHTLSKNSRDGFFYVYKAKLTIEDSSTNQTGLIINPYKKATAQDGCTIKIGNGGELVMNGGNLYGYYSPVYLYTTSSTSNKFELNGGKVSGYIYGVTVLGNDIFTMNGGTVESRVTPIITNGSYSNTNITINDGVVDQIDRDQVAIYDPADGVLTLNGGTIIGGGGVEKRAGTLIIPETSKVKITATKEFSSANNASGSTTKGVAIAISQHSTNKPINVEIDGGTFTSEKGYAVYEVNYNTSNTSVVGISVTGGEFDGELADVLVTSINRENTDIAISGGTFSKEVPEKYCAEGFIPQKNSDNTYGVKEGSYVASIGDKKYETLAEALENAKDNDNDKVTLLDNVTLDAALEVNKSIKLDLDGKDLTLDAVTTISEDKTLTIIDSNATKKGGLKCNKDININGTLDVTAISYGANGLYQGYPGSLAISSTGEVKLMSLWSSYTPNWLMANSSTFFKTPETGAKVTITTNTYTYDETFNLWTKDSSVLYKSTLVREGGSKYNEAYDSIEFAQNKTHKSEDVIYLLKDGASYELNEGETLNIYADGHNATISAKEGYILNTSDEVSGVVTYTVREANYVAQIGTEKYETLAEAISKVEANGTATIKLLTDVTLQEELEIASGKNITIDLANHNITGASTSAAIKIENGNLELAGNGKVIADNSKLKGIYLVGLTDPNAENYSNLVIGSGVTVECNTGYAVMISQNSGAAYGTNITMNGAVLGKYGGIYVNGSINKTTGNVPNIIVTGTVRVTGKDETANGIYAGGYANWTINNAYIEGNTGLYAKAGTFTIENATIKGNRESYIVPDDSGNAGNATGDAIVLDTNTKYAGQLSITITGDTKVMSSSGSAICEAVTVGADSSTINLTISGGTFISGEGQKAVVVSDGFKAALENKQATAAISGGSFSSNVEEILCATGYIPTANEDGTYGVKIGTFVAEVTDVEGELVGKYETLTEALLGANDHDKVTLLQDVALDSSLEVNKDLTFDLDGHTLTVSNSNTIIVDSNKTLEVIDSNTNKGKLYINAIIKVDGTLDIHTLTYGQTGLVSGQSGNLAISSTGKVHLMDSWSSRQAEWLNANSAKFFLASTVGAKAVLGDATYVLTKVADKNVWYVENAVASIEKKFSADNTKTYIATYSSLADAFNNALNGETVTLLTNVTEASVTVKEGTTLDLNNKTLIAQAIINKGTIYIYDANTAQTLIDNWVDGKLVVKNEPGISIPMTQNVNLYEFPYGTEITITNPDHDAADYVEGASTINVKVPSGTLTNFYGIDPKKTMNVDGNVSLYGHIYQGTQKDTTLTINGNATLLGGLVIGDKKSGMDYTSEGHTGFKAHVTITGTTTLLANPLTSESKITLTENGILTVSAKLNKESIIIVLKF